MHEPAWRRYLRFLCSDVAADVDEELRFHLEMRERDYAARGLMPEEARRAARERFGDVERVSQWLRRHDQHRERTVQRREVMAMMLQHLRYGFRGLRKQPAFTAAAVLTFALGIGATAAIFGVVNGVLLKPLPYPHSDQLVGIWHPILTTRGQRFGISHATYVVYRRLNHAFSDIAAHMPIAVNITSASDATPERVAADSATASLFSVLGVHPLIGRTFTAQDEAPGSAPVVIISDGLWRREYGGARDVIGRMLRVNGVSREVIGVMPASMRFPTDQTELWLPLVLDPADPVPIAFGYSGIGRLRPGVTREAAARDLTSLIPHLPEFFANGAPGMTMAQWLSVVHLRVRIDPLRDDIVGDVGRVLWVIFGTIGFVLLAACANIANLFLVRAEGREREFAVHAALGAGRADVLVRFLAEALILAALGTVVGVVLAGVALHALTTSNSLPIPRLADVGIDRTVLAVSVLLCIVVALATSAFPMLRIGRRDLSSALRAGGRGATQGRDHRRVQRGLVVTQVALAFVLLTASALMGRTVLALRQVRLGFDPTHALTFRISLPVVHYPDTASTMGFYDRLTDRLGALPGVRAVGLTSWLPLQTDGSDLSTMFAEGGELSRRDNNTAHPVIFISRDYFQALGIPRMAGRYFQPRPGDQPSTNVIVNTQLATMAWDDSSGQRVLGRWMVTMPAAPRLTVVGVVGSIRQLGLDHDPPPILYVPFNSAVYATGVSRIPRNVAVIVRTRGDPASLAAAARHEVSALDPTLPVYDVMPMQAIMQHSMARTSFTALLLAIAAAVALALGAVGLYGVVAYTVGMRTREIGLRIALGAEPTSVSRMFARQGITLAVLGVGAGIIGAMLVTRVLQALLYGVSATDPVLLGAAAVLLIGVAIAASWMPARRVARVDPASVLSAE